ncbi:MAG: hypothetical protein JSU70_09760 [Phycisphaerales bacterium]|nr:MAG: hypothetical protein JSU70_09760 [Phycisphaerales bacterium]
MLKAIGDNRRLVWTCRIVFAEGLLMADQAYAAKASGSRQCLSALGTGGQLLCLLRE